MSRTTTILLAVGLAVFSGIAICFGFNLKNQTHEIEGNRVEFTCKQLLESRPGDYRLCLTLSEFRPGKHFVEYDLDGDGNWDNVYVPLFPADMKKLGPSYHCVIAKLVDVQNKEQLEEKLAEGKLALEFQSWWQDLDNATYSRMAQRYSSMNFDRNVLLTAEKSNDANMGQMMVVGGGIGVVAAILLGGIGAFLMMLDKLKNRIQKDNAKQITIKNRAGLPMNNSEQSSTQLPVPPGQAGPAQSGQSQQKTPQLPTPPDNGTQLMSERFLNQE